MIFKDSFESTEWTHDAIQFTLNKDGSITPVKVLYGNIFTPKGYTFWYLHGKPVDHDKENLDGWCQPESSYICTFPNRANTGSCGYKFFGFYRIIDAGIYRKFTCNIGEVIDASVYAHAWSSVEDNPLFSTGISDQQSIPVGTPCLTDAQRNASFWIGIDPTGGENPYSKNVIWGEGKHIYNKFDKVSVSTVATTTIFTVFIRAKFLWRFKHNDAYIDDLLVTTKVPEVKPKECTPRIIYERTYNLLPQAATLEFSKKVFEEAFKNKETVGWSADDAGAMDCFLSKNTVKVYWDPNIPLTSNWSSKEAVDNFFKTFYGKSIVKHIGYQPTVPPTTVLPAPKNIISLHVMRAISGVTEYIEKTKPSIIKVFNAPDAREFKKVYPELKVVYRYHVPDDWTYVLMSDKVKAANMFIDKFAAILEANPEVDYIESVNEVYGHDYNNNLQAVAFDVAFAKELYKRFPKVHPCLITAAVGNPHETQFKDLLPAVEKVCEYDGIIGYHAYWPSNKTTTYLLSGWKWYAGRWTEMDKVFVQNKLEPKYFFTEGGICYSEDGVSLSSGLGWKACGDILRYISEMKQFSQKVAEWNAQNNNRARGVAIFSVGSYGWENFDLGTGDILEIIKAFQ